MKVFSREEGEGQSVRIGVKVSLITDHTSFQDQPYPMKLSKMGHAVLLNNLATKVPETVADIEAMKSTLETIGFRVECRNNLNFKVTLFNKLFNFKQQSNLSVVFFIFRGYKFFSWDH